jgi:hypothetical protein
MGRRVASHPMRDLALNEDKFLDPVNMEKKEKKKSTSYKTTTKLKSESKSGWKKI